MLLPLLTAIATLSVQRRDLGKKKNDVSHPLISQLWILQLENITKTQQATQALTSPFLSVFDVNFHIQVTPL